MTLAYMREGSGPPLVLLHGVGHRRQVWDAVMDRLTRHREVIAGDLPGHGESGPMATDRPVTEVLAAALLGLLDDLGLDRPHIAGNSLGGRIALEAAGLGRAATVTALSPAGFWRSDRELAFTRGIFRAMEVLGTRLAPVAPRLARTAAGRAVLVSTIVARPSLMSPEQGGGDLAAFLLAAAPPYTGKVSGDVPVTIGWGSRDRLTSARQAVVAKAWLPEATFVRLPGCGHVPMTDDPALVARVLLRGSARARAS